MMRKNYFALILPVLAIVGLGSASQRPPIPPPNGGMLVYAVTDRNSVSSWPDSEFYDVMDPQARLSTPACDRGIRDKTRASNPFGIVVCYSVLFYDPVNGSFEGDLTVYNVTTPVKEDSNDMTLSISWTVSRAVLVPPNQAELHIAHGRKEGPVKLLSGVKVRGQLLSRVTSSGPSQDDLQAAFIPKVTLSVRSHSGKEETNWTLANGDIVSFFSVNAASPVAHQQQVIEGISKRASADKEFHMPGRTLGIYPTGLIITSVWAALLITIVGYATYERYLFRQHYRRRLRKEIARRERSVITTQ